LKILRIIQKLLTFKFGHGVLQ